MAKNVPVSTMKFPYPLGAITPGANFATACVPLTQNILPTNDDSVTPSTKFALIEIRAWGGDGVNGAAPQGNVGPIYICNSAAPPDVVAFSNVIDVVQPGEAWPRSGNDQKSEVDIANLFVGAGNSTDFAIGNITRRWMGR